VCKLRKTHLAEDKQTPINSTGVWQGLGREGVEERWWIKAWAQRSGDDTDTVTARSPRSLWTSFSLFPWHYGQKCEH